MENHLNYACILRAVLCPFAELGCMSSLCHNEVEKHLDECIQSHLLLSLNRITEQQKVIVAIHQKTRDYDKEILSNKNTLVTLGAAVTAATVMIESVDKKYQKLINEAVKKNDAKSSKEVNLAIGEFRTENSKLRSELNTVKSEQTKVNGGLLLISKDVAEMKRVLPKPPPR